MPSFPTTFPRLILASASPRRRSLLQEARFVFDVEPAAIDEALVAARIPAQSHARGLAVLKARTIASLHTGRPVVVLAADTIVLCPDGSVIGKPANREDARRTLAKLAGSSHSVVTGFCCIRCDDRREITGEVHSHVLMRGLAAAEIDAYLDTGEWQGKAGAYGVQDEPGIGIGAGDPFIESISGELTNIVGLPMPQVIDALGELGIRPDGEA